MLGAYNSELLNLEARRTGQHAAIARQAILTLRGKGCHVDKRLIKTITVIDTAYKVTRHLTEPLLCNALGSIETSMRVCFSAILCADDDAKEKSQNVQHNLANDKTELQHELQAPLVPDAPPDPIQLTFEACFKRCAEKNKLEAFRSEKDAMLRNGEEIRAGTGDPHKVMNETASKFRHLCTHEPGSGFKESSVANALPNANGLQFSLLYDEDPPP
mmetsp:Transcript_9197/g.29196  ORF Transcript_9197/g.29196 Transcript_9197/m.29196 type:complete len:216 (-) Transcript_9197:261-908(-)